MQTTIKNTILLLALLSGISSFAQYSGGTGTADDPFQLATKYDLGYLSTDTLHWGSEDLKFHFILTNDIVFEDADFEPSGDFYNEGKGFIPIGGDHYVHPFYGNFDGKSYTIANIKINRPEEIGVGLFNRGYNSDFRNIVLVDFVLEGFLGVGCLSGLVSDNSYVSNIVVENALITNGFRVGTVIGTLNRSVAHNVVSKNGVIEADNSVGGLIGAVYSSSVENCHAEVDVSGTYSVGGLIGYVNTLVHEYMNPPPPVSDPSYIINCSAYGDVVGTGYNPEHNEDGTGGLIGGLYNNAVVKQCYAYGEVNGGDIGSGQLIGEQCESAIYDSYATGSVTGEDLVAGISSYAYKSSIFNSYATGNIEGVSRVNGVSLFYEGYLYNSYYDYETSGFGNESTGGALATAQFATEEPFLEWNFDTIWCFGKDRDNKIRPILQWMADTITYHLDGGIDTTPNPNYYTGNGDILLEAPHREDYIFLGWYNNALFTGEPQTTITAGTHGNQALWAKWLYNNSVTSENQLKLSLYPNPARESVHITCDKEIITVQLLSISGVVLETVHTKSKEVSMTLTDIASGIYVVRIFTDEKQQVVKLVVK